MTYTTEQDLDIIEYILKKEISIYKEKWINDNTIEFSTKAKKPKLIGKITLDNQKMVVEGTKLEKEIEGYIKAINEAREKLKTFNIQDNTVFKNYNDNKSRFTGISNHIEIIKKVDTALKKMDFVNVLYGKSLTSEKIHEEPHLYITPNLDGDVNWEANDGYKTRCETFLKNEYGINKNTHTSPICSSHLNALSKEKVIDMALKGMEIGKYYPERNVVHLFFNPFSFTALDIVEGEMSVILKDVLSLMKEMKIKKVDNSEMLRKIFITAFLKNTKRRLSDLKTSINNTTRKIGDYEREITSMFIKNSEMEAEHSFLENTLNDKGETLFAEIEKVKKLSFIKDVKTEGATINMTFKETCVPAKDFKRNDIGKVFGVRDLYVGEITFHISSGGFKLSSTAPFSEGNPHPHADNGGSPCFGDGDGRKKINELLAANMFSELAKMLWFWIKTYRNNGAYIKMWAYYDDRLKNGYPVYDENKKLIEINEPDRIKSTEQHTLTKSSSYDENKKRTASFKR